MRAAHEGLKFFRMLIGLALAWSRAIRPDATGLSRPKTNDDSLTPAALRWSARLESSQRCRAADYELLFTIQKELLT